MGPSSILLWQERGGLKNAGILAWQFIVLGVAARINSVLSPGLLFPLLMNMLFRPALSPGWVLGLPWPPPESASCLARTALGPHACSWLEQPVSLSPYPELLLLAGANKPLPAPGLGLCSLGEDLVFQHQLLFFWVPRPLCPPRACIVGIVPCRLLVVSLRALSGPWWMHKGAYSTRILEVHHAQKVAWC